MKTSTPAKLDFIATFEGYRITAGAGRDRFVIYRPDGTRLGACYSVQGYKRMVSKDAGTNACECGDIPGKHWNSHETIPGTNTYRVVGRCTVSGCPCRRTIAQARACRAPERSR